jgi:anthranilate phosphoribosyltransferase
VHKKSNVFIQSGKEKEQEKKIDYTIIMNEPTVKQIQSAFTELKAVSSSRAQVAGLGEAALNGGEGPAASIIGYHAATLCHLLGQASDLQTTYDKAIQILNSKTCYQKLMEFLEECKRKD